MRRHPFDPLSAAFGVIAIAVGVLVISGRVAVGDSDASRWWLPLAALVIGLGLIPWGRRRTAEREPADEPPPSHEPVPSEG